MYSPILATKLYLPPPRANLLHRHRLTARLNDGLSRRLTLIAAPAGFGKSTVVTDWLASCQRPAAWLSLDEGDNDPARFLAYLVAALQRISADLGAGVLQGAAPVPTESMLTLLLNEIAALPAPFVLVLDDYHVIEATPVKQALTFLLEHLPPQMHLVITTRHEPDLPLARLRARDQLLELRAPELSFTLPEATAFLQEVMGLDLSPDSIALLATRVEGWVAGLQMAGLSLQGRPESVSFIEAFTGTHRFVLDYLVEEVLQRQPAEVRSFLLQTAILDSLSGPLCDAVTGRTDGGRILAGLERGNLFVVPLDEQRRWYRYHHLFAEVLQAQLMAEQPTLLPTLHRRASDWYQPQGLTAKAIDHALAAVDLGRAADLAELAWPAMRSGRQESTFLGWLKALPEAVLQQRPVLSVGYAWALLAVGELEGAQARLQAAERWLQAADQTPGMVVVDEAEFRRLPGAIAVYRSALAQALGDLPGAVKYARQVLELLPEEEYLGRGAAAALLGLAAWSSGQLEDAHQAFAAGLISVQRAGNLADVIGGTIALAEIRLAQGRLQAALDRYDSSLRLAEVQGGPPLRGAADLYVGLSELHRERNDLQAAAQALQYSKELDGLPQNRYRWSVAMARIRETEGDLAGALTLLHEAERHYVRDFFPNVRPVAALKARVWIRQGQLDRALGWARERSLSAAEEPHYLREFELITLARLLLAQHSFPEAMGLLERLLQAAEAGGRMGSAIEILILQAVGYQMQGEIAAALQPLKRALTLAEPEGYVRLFVDEGPPMAALLEAALKDGGAPGYRRQVLAALGKGEAKRSPSLALIEPLSEREREVLRLLGTEASGPEIARHLIVSLNTLRTHTKHIYEKLGVANRRAAVRRAAELGLL